MITLVEINFRERKLKNNNYFLNWSMKCTYFHIVRYGCRRGIKHRGGHSCSRPRGVGVPPCDLENLADAIKMIMGECENAGLFCELQEGTLLGRCTPSGERGGARAI